MVWRFFDGTYQGSLSICGEGDIMSLNEAHFISSTYVVVPGSNNIVWSYALWFLLKIAIKRGIPKLEIVGESKLIKPIID